MRLPAQVIDQNYRLFVLQQNVIDSEYKFIDKKDSTETYLKYLGQITTKKGITYKVMTSVWIWGLSRRATNRILIFNGRNQYLGNYYSITCTSFDLPNKIINDNLIFYNTGCDTSECDPQLVTTISFRNGLPKNIFRKCKKYLPDTVTGNYRESGDIYSFEGGS